MLDVPQNPPPAMELGFTPSRPYVPSIPSMFATVQDRLPALLDRTEATLQTLREIVARVPDSLDRSDRFFTNVERIVQESQLPALSADSRKFFATTSASDRADQVRDGWGDWHRGRRWSSSLKRHGPRSRPQTFRPRPNQRATRRTTPDLRQTISGAPCRPFGIRSNRCANSRASSRNSPSRWSMVHDQPEEKHR